MVSQLYSKDIIFNNENEISYDGKHTKMDGVQMNAMYLDDYPIIRDNATIFYAELKKLVSFIEANDKLRIPKTKFHKNILKATRNNPITGTTLFGLCAWHMIIYSHGRPWLLLYLERS